MNKGYGTEDKTELHGYRQYMNINAQRLSYAVTNLARSAS